MVERFNPNWNPACVQGMHKFESGDYVRHSDYADLERQITELRAERDRFSELYAREAHTHMVSREAAEADKARLSEALAEIEGRDSHIDATPRGGRKVVRGDFANIARAALSGSSSGGWQATHRHVKRGSEYVLLGIGKMQAEYWREYDGTEDPYPSVDMREVAIYRSIDDDSLWARPREEFEDGRFEPLPTSPTGDHHD